MSDLYKKAKPGRLTFKGGDPAAPIDKKRKKKKPIPATSPSNPDAADTVVSGDAAEAAAEASEKTEEVYTIDAAKKMKYEELFPVESKKFRYDPANKERSSARRVEEALDDRVKKKADRYCK